MAAGTGQCSNTDETTAAAARAALQDFYTKFPELLAAPLYITGESYAGNDLRTKTQHIITTMWARRILSYAARCVCAL